jgi:hypothetical protein
MQDSQAVTMSGKKSVLGIPKLSVKMTWHEYDMPTQQAHKLSNSGQHEQNLILNFNN